MPVFDHFSWIAPFYERAASPPDPQIWKQRLNLPVSGLLLDAGGGTGRISAPLRAWVGGVVLADSSWGMVRQAIEKNNLRVVCSEAEQLPFTSIFDRILLVDALHHVRNQRETARELFRVLAPGGRLVVVEPDIRRGAVKLVALIEKLLLMRSHMLPPSEIAALFDGLPARVQVETVDFSVIVTVERAA